MTAVDIDTRPAPRSASNIADEAQALVYDLRERLAAAERTASEIPAKREALAFKASQGNQRAKRSLAELATQEADAKRESDDLRAALTEARRRLEAARAAEHEETDATMLATAHRLAEEFIEASASIDRALANIAVAHKRRSELRLMLASTGCVENLSNLDCWIRMRLAVAHAGAFEILCAGANAPARDDRVALATSDRRTLSGIGMRR